MLPLARHLPATLPVLLVLALLASAASAQEPTPRVPPNYDGRDEAPATTADVLLWVPRVVFFPIYLVTDYVIRRPLGWVVTTAEEEDVPAKLVDLFTFGEEGELALVPTALLDFGFRPSVGAYFRWNQALHSDNKVRLYAATGGPDWYRVSAADRIDPDDGNYELQLAGDYVHRPDMLFYGIGEDNSDSLRSRFEIDSIDVNLSFQMEQIWRASSVRFFTGFRRARFDDDTCCAGPPLARRFERGELSQLPPGYSQGYDEYYQRAELTLDTRRERPATGSGVRLRGWGEHAFDVASPLANRWVRYGGSASVYLDVSGTNKVLSLTGYVDNTQAIDGEVPFTLLPDLGGDGPMKGFIGGRMIGPSAAAAVLEYRWPIWLWLDGSTHAALGNVFERDLEGFELDRLRMSFGLALRTSGTRDHSFDLTVATGTKTFENGAFVDGSTFESFRFVIGGNQAF